MTGTLHTATGWCAITEPDLPAQWFPADVIGDRRLAGKIRFVVRNGEGPTLDGAIAELDPPRIFAYTWGDSLLRFELRSEGQGCLLVFTHTFDAGDEAGKFAAGWHVCLDALESVLDGEPVAAAHNRWSELHEGYAKRFA